MDHIAGLTNSVSDALLRYPWSGDTDQTGDLEIWNAVIAAVDQEVLVVDWSGVKKHSKADADLAEVMKLVRQGDLMTKTNGWTSCHSTRVERSYWWQTRYC